MEQHQARRRRRQAEVAAGVGVGEERRAGQPDHGPGHRLVGVVEHHPFDRRVGDAAGGPPGGDEGGEDAVVAAFDARLDHVVGDAVVLAEGERRARPPRGVGDGHEGRFAVGEAAAAAHHLEAYGHACEAVEAGVEHRRHQREAQALAGDVGLLIAGLDHDQDRCAGLGAGGEDDAGVALCRGLDPLVAEAGPAAEGEARGGTAGAVGDDGEPACAGAEVAVVAEDAEGDLDAGHGRAAGVARFDDQGLGEGGADDRRLGVALLEQAIYG